MLSERAQVCGFDVIGGCRAAGSRRSGPCAHFVRSACAVARRRTMPQKPRPWPRPPCAQRRRAPPPPARAPRRAPSQRPLSPRPPRRPAPRPRSRRRGPVPAPPRSRSRCRASTSTGQSSCGPYSSRWRRHYSCCGSGRPPSRTGSGGGFHTRPAFRSATKSGCRTRRACARCAPGRRRQPGARGRALRPAGSCLVTRGPPA